MTHHDLYQAKIDQEQLNKYLNAIHKLDDQIKRIQIQDAITREGYKIQ